MFVSTAEIDTEFHMLSAALVISTSAETVTVDFTRYAVPGFVERTVALAVFFNVALVNVTVGGPLSMSTEVAITADTGPVLPESSLTVLAFTCNARVPFPQLFTVTTITVPDEDAGLNVHPVAVPVALEKSDDVKPLTGSLNVRVNVSGNTRIGELGTAIDTVGAVVSIVNVEEVETTESFPAVSVKMAEIVHVPSLRPLNEQVPVEADTDAVQVAVLAPEVAVKVNVPVASGVVALTFKVVRFVFESVELIPVSDPAATRGAAEALGAVRSIVRVLPVKSAAGPVLLARSDTALASNFGITVPSLQPLVLIVMANPADTSGDNTHPVAVPLYVKSADSTPVTCSFIVSTNEGVKLFVGVTEGVIEDTTGFVRSMRTVAPVTVVAGPVLPNVSLTVFAFCARITVPSLQPVKVTVTAIPVPALKVPPLQPVAVPEREKSPIKSPDIDSL